MKKLSHRTITIMLTLFTTFCLINCTKAKDEKPANMEEIYKDLGVPVRVQTINFQEFNKELDYSVTVEGLREAPVYASLSDQVYGIKAQVGQMVEKDQIIIEFPQNNPQASYFQAKAAYDLAEQTWSRMQSLHETGGLSRQDLDGAETSFKVAEANWNSVQKAVHVRAPFSGLITDMNVREMERVAAGDYLFTVSQLNKLHGRIWVPENNINSIKKDAEVVFRWNDVEKKAKIANLSLSLNRDHNAFAIDIEIENTDYFIRSGVTGKAIVSIYNNKEAVIVPRNIIRRDINGQPFVYVVINDFAVRRDIVIGEESELNLEIKEGLKLGDQLIVQGYQMVDNNTKINYK